MAEIASIPKFRPGGTVRWVTTHYKLTGDEIVGDWVVIGELPGSSMALQYNIVHDDCGDTDFAIDLGDTVNDDSIAAAIDLSAAGSSLGTAVATPTVPTGINGEIRMLFDDVGTIIAGADIWIAIMVVDFMDT